MCRTTNATLTEKARRQDSAQAFPEMHRPKALV
jgi:hypothetical protein